MKSGENSERPVKTRGPLKSAVKLPGSKSITARALLIASLCEEPVRVENPLDSDDIRRMMDGLRAFGSGFRVEDDVIEVSGTGGKLEAPVNPIFLGGSGTAMRLLTPYASLAPGGSLLDGDSRLRERPMEDLLEALTGIGVMAESLGGNGCPPIRVPPGGLKGGFTRVKGWVSSQYLSGILLSAPYAAQPVTVEVIPPLSSRPYVDITLRVMESFGVRVEEENGVFRVPKGKYRNGAYRVEPDASSASYALAAAALLGGEVFVEGLGSESIQGDARFVGVLEKMGCSIAYRDGGVELRGPAMSGVDVDMNSMPDLVPTLSVVAAATEGVTRIRNVEHLRVKESDRLSSVTQELRKMGGLVEEAGDGLVIRGGELHGAAIDTYNDHRIAMAFAVLGLRVPGVTIRNPGCVNKSFPGFWEVFEGMQ